MIGQFIKETLTTAYKHHIDIPTDFVLYGRTVAIIEGLAQRYDPSFPFYTETKAILKKILTPEYVATELYDRTKTKVFQYTDLIESFPETAKEILEKAKNFKVNIDVEDDNVKNLTTEIERSSGNISLGFIIAALIIASALIMMTNKPASFYISGFSLATVLGLWLVKRTIFVKTKN